MSKPFYIESPVKFDAPTGIAVCERTPLERRYSGMKNMYLAEDARQQLEDSGDAVIYRFYDLGVPEDAGELAFGTSIVYPGKVGEEYHMTNGHYHTILETAEVYYCQAVYVPSRYAHRSINLSLTETLITFYVFRADAGHNYGSIKEKGFRKLVVEKNGTWTIINNPRWEE